MLCISYRAMTWLRYKSKSSAKSRKEVFKHCLVSAFFGISLFVFSGTSVAAPACGAIFQSLSSRGLPLIAMDSHYRGEDRGQYFDPVTKTPWHVKYMTESEKKPYELHIKDHLFWTSQGKKVESEFDAEAMSFETSLIVIDRNHRIFILPFEQRGKYHHSTLSAGEEVLFAGTAAFSGGRLRELSDNSGHYKPSVEQTLLVLRDLKKMGMDLSSLKVSGRIAKALKNTYVLTPKEVAELLGP